VTDTNVVIIGAGLAGLGAAAACRDAGRTAIVLEASGRVGGRAWTDYPAAFGGIWFDMGAIWFHNAEHNPLVPLARAAGDTLLRSDEIRQERTFIGNRMANEVELTAFADAWPRYEAAADAILAIKDDVSLAEVTRQLPDDPWARLCENSPDSVRIGHRAIRAGGAELWRVTSSLQTETNPCCCRPQCRTSSPSTLRSG
jgi:monoamine oxidase